MIIAPVYIMITRAQYKILMTPSEIDFDEASKAWLKNKRKLSNGSYEYVNSVKSTELDTETVVDHPYNTRSRSKLE
jgi:hypothetical protein